MKISILCKYHIIHEGIKSILKEKHTNITSFFSIEECYKALEVYDENFISTNEDTILIITLFREDLKSINNILSIKDKYSNLKLLIIDFNDSKDMFFKISKLNIDGYMLATLSEEDINYAIHKISSGNKFYDRELIYRLVEIESAATITGKSNSGNPLTRRELEILSQ